MNTMIKIAVIGSILVAGCDTSAVKSESAPVVSVEPMKTEDMSMLCEPAEASILVIVSPTVSASASASPVSSAKK